MADLVDEPSGGLHAAAEESDTIRRPSLLSTQSPESSPCGRPTLMPIDADAAKIAQCERVAKMRVAKKGRRGNQRLALKKKKHATKIKVIAAELECKPHPQMVRRGPRFRPENSQSAREGQATNSQLRKESSKAMAQVP